MRRAPWILPTASTAFSAAPASSGGCAAASRTIATSSSTPWAASAPPRSSSSSYATWRQPDLFFGEKQPAKTLRPERAYRPAARSAPEPFAWESMGAWVRLIHRLFAIEEPSSDHYRRSRETARELTVTRVRACRHDDDLERVEQMLTEARSGWLYGLDRAFTKAERGELLVEVRNRRRLLALGRSQPKTKGPRLDVSRLPDAALDRLIQGHADLVLVDRLRRERERRIGVAHIGTDGEAPGGEHSARTLRSTAGIDH